MRKIRNILLAVMVAACALIVAACSSGNEKKESQATGELSGEIVMWHSFINKEMKYLHEIMQGAPVTKEFEKLLTGEAALEAIATADACTRSINEDRKVKLAEIMN